MIAGHGGEWGGEEGGHTMVKVLCSQRDRFKDRGNQLELQLAQVHFHPYKTAYSVANAVPCTFCNSFSLCPTLLQVLLMPFLHLLSSAFFWICLLDCLSLPLTSSCHCNCYMGLMFQLTSFAKRQAHCCLHNALQLLCTYQVYLCLSAHDIPQESS